MSQNEAKKINYRASVYETLGELWDRAVAMRTIADSAANKRLCNSIDGAVQFHRLDETAAALEALRMAPSVEKDGGAIVTAVRTAYDRAIKALVDLLEAREEVAGE